MRRLIMLAAGSFAVYRYRYRIVNFVLGQPQLRRYFINLSMRIPFIRDRFVNRAFH
ncbi:MULTISPECIES: hypothetical protein [Metabacillus]|jgi:hypothetical protein|uniref:Uncharacterized protein n=1 Tax=Metabacillus endolithicus TaxID=1535204 RepID=A0ABW5BVM8_9BACI|nr:MULTISPECIES: hypothetical protein [Metabacillus]MCM3412629.1 hypothetical protein [Metabacillus litoralis]UHA57848.1 hypothetical protein KDJ21_013180 [Metabacillus litoralis]UPG64551.1 hypothetical protein MVE64_05585 [Metabacillus endolithicus]